MEEINAGGAAFPHAFVVEGPAIDPVTGAEVPDGRKHGHYFPGMTLRDYFAAHAPAMPSGFDRKSRWEERVVERGVGKKEIISVNVDEAPADFMARWAIAYADAMLAARGAS